MVIASFFGDLRSFVDTLGDVALGPLLLGMALFVAYLSLRALAFRNILQDAYPHTTVPYREIWGAYLAAYGFNNVIPARGGDVLKVYLTKTSVPGATYPTIGAALLVEAIFDLCAGALAVTFAIAAGVFPQPPDWVSLDAVDLSFVVADGRRALFLVTALAIGVLVLFSLVALRVRRFWENVRQGFAVLEDRRRYLRRVWGVQGIGWLVRGTAFYFFLRAFGMPASVETVMFVLSANAVAAVFPFTPGGAGVVQGLLLQLFSGMASGAAIAAYGVGQQAVIAVLSLAVGFIALAWVFQVRSFKQVIAQGQADRAAERAARQQAQQTDVHAAAATASSGPGAAAAQRDGDDDRLWSTEPLPPQEPLESAGTAVWVDASTEADDWLAEEVAPDVDRARRLEERARWRRRRR